MGSNLLSLERSLGALRRRKHAQAKIKSPTEGAAAQPSYGNLQRDIEVVRGERVGVPTSGLQALEDRLLGRHSSTNTPQRHVQRLDQGQLTQLPPQPVAPVAVPVQQQQQVHPSAQSWNAYALDAVAPVPQLRYDAAGIQNYPQSSSSYNLSPEFSAPDAGRFNVEAFSEPLSPDSMFKPDPALVAAPSEPAVGAAPNVTTTQPNLGQNGQAYLTAPAPTANPSLLTSDDGGWMSGAQSQQPAKVTSESKKSLNADAALAKDEFERELAAILGQAPASQSNPVDDAPFDPSKAPPPTALSSDPIKPEELPVRQDHSVFDRMGLGMQYANSFDLGNVSLSDKFDRFDREIAGGANARPRGMTAEPAPTFANPFVDSMSLDDFDLMAELAEISTERPSSPEQTTSQVAQPNTQPGTQATQQVTEPSGQPATQPSVDVSGQAPSYAQKPQVDPKILPGDPSQPPASQQQPYTSSPSINNPSTPGESHEQ